MRMRVRKWANSFPSPPTFAELSTGSQGAGCWEVQGACRAGKMGNCIGGGKTGETQQEHGSEKTVGGAVAATILAY